jgi:membrane dipeptidase
MRLDGASGPLGEFIMNRRQFVSASAAAAASAWVAPGAAAGAQAGAAVSESEARAIYQKGIVIDALGNPGSMNVPWPPRGPLSERQLGSLRQSGITGVNTTVSADTFEGTIRSIALWQGEATRYPAVLSIVRTHADLLRTKQNGQVGIILGFQNTEMLERDLTRLDVFHQLGVRIIQLTYNDRNLLGDGCLEPGNAGLSTLGRQAVARMNELRIAVDLSHCGTQTTADGIAVSKGPVLITHSGCREIYRHPRSKEDREMKALADKGGVMGIYFMPFLGAGQEGATVDRLLEHIEHALKVCGTDHVGIGSDLSITPIDETTEYRAAQEAFVEGRRRRGIQAPDEEKALYIKPLNHPRRIEDVAAARARRGHASTVIEKVIGGNFARVLKEIWGE